MSRKILFSSIASFFSDESKILERGENSYRSGKVMNFVHDGELKLIKGAVSASMKQRQYSVQVFFNENYFIQKAECTCPRGAVKCHHMAALLLHAHYALSATDASCSWVAPKGVSTTLAQPIEELFPSKDYNPIAQPVDRQGIKEDLLKKLDSSGATVGHSWLLAPEPNPTSSSLAIPEVLEIITSNEFRCAPDKIIFFKEAMKLDGFLIDKIFTETIGQGKNPLWLKVKSHRLTASNFGSVLKAARRNSFPPSLFKKIAGIYSLDGIRAVQWGTDNEAPAIEFFERVTLKKVMPCGIKLSTNGFIGASPDGFIEGEEHSFVEIKCPYKYRDAVLQDVLKQNQDYILYIDSNGETQINKSHIYYDQIQGTMFLCNKMFCYLIIYSIPSVMIHLVERDDDWAPNMSLLENFYLYNYLNYLIEDNKTT